jgi:hypothetical protein
MQNNIAVSENAKQCKICAALSEQFGRATVLEEYEITYYRCTDCGFVQTEEPYWLDHAYSDPIATLDIGLLSRNVRLRQIASRVLRLALTPESRCVDYGGGYGVFVRLMRDSGFNFSHYDPMAKNLFASHFIANLDDRFSLATAFEVLEHLVNPHEHFLKLDKLADHWLVTTELISPQPPPLGKWWYYLPETGQHVSFYTRKSLEHIAAMYDRRLVSSGNGLHFFTKCNASDRKLRWILKNRSSRLLDAFSKRRSLLNSDFELMRSSLGRTRSVA